MLLRPMLCHCILSKYLCISLLEESRLQEQNRRRRLFQALHLCPVPTSVSSIPVCKEALNLHIHVH